MGILDGIVQGVTSAMSPAVAQENANKRAEERTDRRATKREELEATTKSIMDNVRGVQDKIAALGPNPDPKQVAPYAAQLQQLEQQFRDLYHPVKNPGHLSFLGQVLGSLRGQQPDQAGTVDQMVQGDVAGAGVSQTQANPYADERRNLKAVGVPDADIDKAIRHKAGIEDKPDADWKITDIKLPNGQTISAQVTKSGEFRDLAGNPIPKALLSGATLVGKEPNRDDKYLAILSKQNSGQPLTQDEKDYKGAYDLWVKQTKVEPGVARAAAFGANRFIPVMDPSNPENVTFMRVGDAAKTGALSPQSISFQIDKAVTKSFTSGPAATTINYFNTATDHLKLLQQTADALKNGDVPAFNKAANSFATATGSAAPSNFDTVRSAVAGELAKTFKGTGATDEEIGLIATTINNSQSPEQLRGAIQYYLRLMDGKMQALKGQYDAARQGKPNFPDSDVIYARDPQGKLHKANKGTPLPQGWKVENAPTAKQ